MSMQSQDIIKRSATNSITPPPQARDDKFEVAKLIDVSTCIGCKACQVACSEWNDIRDEVGFCTGFMITRLISAPNLDCHAVQRDQRERQTGWLIRKDGCMHCSDPGCLKACPSAGAIIQYANGIVDFQSEHCIGCGYCIAGCPFNIPRLNPKDNRCTNAHSVLTGQRGPGACLCENLSDRCYPFRHQKTCWKWRTSAYRS